MKKQPFEDMDQKLFDGLKSLREKKASGEVMADFSNEIDEKILRKQKKPSWVGSGVGSWAMAGVPVLAVLVLASLLVMRMPNFNLPAASGVSSQTSPVELAQVPADELSDQALVKELSDSLDDDDINPEDLDDETLAALELS